MKIDVHVHTCEVSPCGKVPAREMIRLYQDAGYGLVVVTDHLFPSLETAEQGATLEEKARLWLRGYDEAKQEGKKIGLKVLLGAELRLETYGNEDFLAYGFAREDVAWLFALLERAQSVEQMSQELHGRGIFLSQAHPFRPGLRAQDTALLDAVEAHNGNPRHNSSNHLALAHALCGGVALLSGSDAHQPQDVGCGGLIAPDDICDEETLVRWLRNGAPRTEAEFAEKAIRARQN